MRQNNGKTNGIPIRPHSVVMAEFKNDILALAGAGKLAKLSLPITTNEVFS